jgi:transcriptional regulator with XRE-family HTH domain
MAENVSAVSRAISDELTGAYSKRRLTQEEIARKTDMPLVTVQKKLRGRAPISATDLVILAQAIGVDPAKVLADAMTELEAASEGVASLAEQRRKKTPATMTDDELEGERNAANTDPEMGGDESEAP